MQSQSSSKAEGRHPLPLPWGFGSMAWHGKNWWLIYRDAENKVHYENSGTADAAEAQKVLAGKALPRARAILATLERIAYEGETYRGDSSTGPRARRRRADRGVKRPKRDGEEVHQGDVKAGAGARRAKAGGSAKKARGDRPATRKGGTS